MTSNPTNACGSIKQDRAITNVVYHMLRVYYMLQRSNSTILEESPFSNIQLFKALLVEQLKVAGIADPFTPIKSKGVIGEDVLDSMVTRFLTSLTITNVSTSRSTPGVVSVIGSILSQEIIKGVTSIYAPISQWQFFESLDSVAIDPSFMIPTSDEGEANGTTTEEILDELKTMKIFVVGAGAIGCELLKNFALLGAGSSSFNQSRDESSNVADSIWSKAHLSQGGIIVTDMDLIEKSNLNRQLLFR